MHTCLSMYITHTNIYIYIIYIGKNMYAYRLWTTYPSHSETVTVEPGPASTIAPAPAPAVRIVRSATSRIRDAPCAWTSGTERP